LPLLDCVPGCLFSVRRVGASASSAAEGRAASAGGRYRCLEEPAEGVELEPGLADAAAESAESAFGSATGQAHVGRQGEGRSSSFSILCLSAFQ
jgi:hypothetical protein